MQFPVNDLLTRGTPTIKFDRSPTDCPFCHTAIKVDPLNIYKIDSRVYQTHCCPKCERIFIAFFIFSNNVAEFKFSYPNKNLQHSFSEIIHNISPNFVKIYNQAYTAEQEKLDEICGMGYRKALEFLIKDFLISFNKPKKENIQNTPLGHCIDTYVTHNGIKICASRAAWLGNDECHYLKKHTNKDLTDLKQLINATVSWIETEIITADALNIEPQ